jgi:hypothetical protein
MSQNIYSKRNFCQYTLNFSPDKGKNRMNAFVPSAGQYRLSVESARKQALRFFSGEIKFFL